MTTGRWWRHAVGPGALGATACGIGIFRVYHRQANLDMAWIVFEAGRMLRGAHLYDGVVEANPPLIFALSRPAAALAQATGLTDVAIFSSAVLILAVASVGACAWLFWRAVPAAPRAFHRWWLAMLAFGMLALPAFHFGQREHLMVILTAPYLCAAIGRHDGVRFPVTAMIAVGIAAGLGVALKPPFVLFPVAVEATLFNRSRNLRILRRPELLAAVAVVAAYVLAVVLFTPEYLTLARMVAPAYPGFRHRGLIQVLLRPDALTSLASLLIGVVLRPLPWTRAPRQILLAAVGSFLAIAFLQQKGWQYQLYPAAAGSLLLLTAAVFPILSGDATVPRPRRAVIVTAAGCYLVLTLLTSLFATLTIDTPGGRAGGVRHEVATLVERYAPPPRGGVAMLSTNFGYAFPMVNYTGVRWTMRGASLWALESIYGMGDSARGPAALHPLGSLGPLEERIFRATADDLVRDPPTLLFVDISHDQPVDYVAYFSRDPGVAALLKGYAPLSIVGPFAVFRHVGDRGAVAVESRGPAE